MAPIYFEQLTSERRVVRYARGLPLVRFERIKGKRAETLDATVYAWAVRQLINQNLDTRGDELKSAAAPEGPKIVIKSRWLDGGDSDHMPHADCVKSSAKTRADSSSRLGM
ncbi:MAG: hypothetical protein GXP05_13990 [Alphaproteobacteria bacterium]|nr:hypothetical protein [Alphaproteobacteria bacterium]